MLVAISTIGVEEKWVVKYLNNDHNHELLDDKEVQFLPAYRSIPIVDQSRIMLLSKAGCSISLIMRVLELEKEICTGNLPFLEKDIRNFIQSQSGIGKESDASDVLKLCKSLKDIDDAFKYEFTIDESNKLEHIIWAFGDSIRAYEAFGDVVVFDTTYRINRYDMPLGIWVGVDNHRNTILFGCVLLRDEKISSFTWALKTFLAFVEGKYPKTILTDQDPALKEAIAIKYLPFRWRLKSSEATTWSGAKQSSEAQKGSERLKEFSSSKMFRGLQEFRSYLLVMSHLEDEDVQKLNYEGLSEANH
ncbi:hypothetical protein TSUD_179540 [Trifolium subterraneum]|uniref:Uncharacterized protein n=1 Tax=Trifolium subterraneum TaxID=3900 RepID=A0A2Z6NC41_TRISU|nr:hypothetical protein TSUD_179540 [Trifolium subterraneum]